MPAPQLAGKVALVTGAGRGIGRAIALAYGAAGARVACAARTVPEIEAAAAAIRAGGGAAIAIPTDVTRPDAVRAMYARAIEAFGGIDIVVINAGASPTPATVEQSDPGEWAATLGLNLTAAYHCAREAIPHLKARGGGKIITIGSGLGHRGMAGRSAYAVSKAGLWMLTRVLAQELAGHNISVNELVPGPVQTGAEIPAGGPFAIPGEWVKQPADVSGLALFLATLPDGGPTAQSFSLMRRDG